nr:hypothetical protein CTI12_AA008570 [Tanacetum cinerariifolium]
MNMICLSNLGVMATRNIMPKRHAEVPNPEFVNKKIRSIEANHVTVSVVGNNMIVETSIRSGNPPEQAVRNIIYVNVKLSGSQPGNNGFNNVENDAIQVI